MNALSRFRIGIVGVGLMGHAIAMNIQKHGWETGFLDHPGNQPSDDLIAKGAVVFKTGAELAAASDVIILCVTGFPQVEDIMTRADGVLAEMGPGKIVLDCSTSIPSSSVKMAGLVAEAGGVFLDAPMTRTPKEAVEGRLNLIIGGDKEVLQSLMPLLECFAENITHAGDVGAGHALKLIHNFVSLAGCAVVAEASAAAHKAGIQPSLLYNILNEGGGRGVVLERMKPFLLDKDTSAFQFSIQNGAKDTGYFLTMSENMNSEGVLAEAVARRYRQSVDRGNGDRYIPELIDLD